ncbi:hypothetical protein ACPPTR_04425 [Ralstonia pseudosolanacearum]|uniref:hypothetical protein n=1 Tax=Ralstonia pseudosolanacearum TaxID=1310165 RepID=UPI001E3B2883|nr:hypothetical protein [Ralstonia pseudosolanacearum]
MRVRPCCPFHWEGGNLTNSVVLCNFHPNPLIYKEMHATVSAKMPRFCHNLFFGRFAARTLFFSFFLLKSKRKRKKAEKRETTGMPRFGVAGHVGMPRNGGRATGDFVAGQIVAL